MQATAWDALTDKQREVATRVLAEAEAKRRHVVIALSGAHAYGFPSPDSDLDLKAIHIERAEELLGLGKPRDAYDRLEVIEGVEIDYTSNELRGVLTGIAAGNGNYIERILGHLICASSTWHDELRALIAPAISQRVHRHYRGFAYSQRKDFEAAASPTAKKLLYVLRTALTGTHLLRTGELRIDLNDNAAEYGFAEAVDLIEAKKAGEQSVLGAADVNYWQGRLDAVFETLDRALEHSTLPSEPALDDLAAWLVEQRRRDLCEG